MISIQAQQTLSMYTRDGVRLDADVYFPKGAGPFPVLLMRQPYGRAIASTVVYAHPRWYAAHGYIVAIQDVRGRGTSEGEFSLFAYEVLDGEDAVEWAARLPGSDGQVAMYGFSYQGMTQLQAAQSAHPALKTIVPAMTGYHLYEDWAYENGALCFHLGLVWAIQLAAQTAQIEGDSQTYQKLVAAARTLPTDESTPGWREVLADVDTFFHDWVSAPKGDRYWQQLTPQLDQVDLPMLHVGGWFDPYLRGDLRRYLEMAARSRYLHHFWVGPWIHIPWGRKVGAMDFGPAAASPIDRLQLQWFDGILKGENMAKLRQSPPVNLFEMGRNQWRSLDAWPTEQMTEQTTEQLAVNSAVSRSEDKTKPENNTITYFLYSDGLANVREDSGVLSESLTQMPQFDTLVHDPWNPCPAAGGHSSIPAGVFERTAVDARGDVLTYTSAPFAEELRVVGVPKVVIAIAASTTSYDLCAILSRVVRGNVYNLTQGYGRFQHLADRELVGQNSPGQSLKGRSVSLPLHPTCFSLFPGESLRLSLSAACYPAFSINLGTGASQQESKAVDARIIMLTIALGGNIADQWPGCDGTLLKLPVVLD
ncbi:hydrolase CocE/NonD family protein [Synechococcus sp. PCC 7335]|uniref:CocE/NonD family hydrolase n=1 Tax=Synechococcus sp. (strain ATCC 29403 / PCC 7335) TaxID=91464 RepID=UPI00017EE446|nr:CocE/NonD family hydrolase [Synechococcus sp. PCC 7335]EDX85621.1 hydrolase CocE/NonD family protein [Synechococcus sp. PCC 7335]